MESLLTSVMTHVRDDTQIKLEHAYNDEGIYYILRFGFKYDVSTIFLTPKALNKMLGVIADYLNNEGEEK
ncbi:MAG: hypothetical protein GY853_15385 [PVC group bacterium]|nr:hypothetical protein [PVC group bacterium]